MSENDQVTEAVQGEEQAAGPHFQLQRIYVKDISFEAPLGAAAFTKEWAPAVNQDINTKTTQLDENNFEVVLTLTVTVKLAEETAFLIEVQQAGIFTIAGFDQAQMAPLLGSSCPNILFPYAREAIDNMCARGSFPTLMLPPINFDALFQAAVAQAQAEQSEVPAS